jgi:hypothetical protein
MIGISAIVAAVGTSVLHEIADLAAVDRIFPSADINEAARPSRLRDSLQDEIKALQKQLDLEKAKTSNLAVKISQAVGRSSGNSSDLRSSIRHAQASFDKGQIAFNPPSNMHQGVSDYITVRISRSAADSAIALAMSGGGVVQRKPINVGDIMQVSLVGKDGAFDVLPLRDSEQAIADGDFNEWVFQVTPLKSGNHVLELQAVIKIRLSDTLLEPLEITAIDKPIVISVDQFYPIKKFFNDPSNLKWVAGGLFGVLVSIGGFFLKRRFDNRKKVERRRGSDVRPHAEKSFWVTFESGQSGCLLATDESNALRRAHQLEVGDPVKIELLPHPADPRLDTTGHFDDAYPSICTTPKYCAGRVRCPKTPNCVERAVTELSAKPRP